MKALIQGGESKERFDLILSLTRLDEVYHKPLERYYVDGVKGSSIVEVYELRKQHFTRAKNTLESVAQRIEKIKEMDWAKFKKVQDDNEDSLLSAFGDGYYSGFLYARELEQDSDILNNVSDEELAEWSERAETEGQSK